MTTTAVSVVFHNLYCCLFLGLKLIYSWLLLLFEWQYAEKAFVRKPKENQYPNLVAQQIWDGVRSNDKKAVYRHVINSEADVNAVYKQMPCGSLTLAKVMLMQEPAGPSDFVERSTSPSNSGCMSEGSQPMEDLDGCTLLHLACETADIGMLELLLQCGANINAIDSRHQSALHHCILKGRAAAAKLLLSRLVIKGEEKESPFSFHPVSISAPLMVKKKNWLYTLQGSGSTGGKWGR